MPQPQNSIWSTSLEEVPALVTTPVGINPTGSTVQMAFLALPPPTQPAANQWQAAIWQSTSQPFTALCLVGPNGTITLAAGQWYVWVKITGSPEIPVKFAGVLQVN